MSTENDIQTQMFEVGAHYGFNRARRHPSMRDYVFTTKNGTDIIDLSKTAESFDAAKDYIKTFAQGEKKIIFVGVKAESKKIIKEAAVSIGASYVVNRWVGGSLTNYSEIKKRIARLKEIRSMQESGDISKYTKKEQLLIEREAIKLDIYFGGIQDMGGIPDLMVVVDPRHEHIAVMEAKKTNIPVIALASTDCDVSNLDFTIPANDGAIASVTYFINGLVDAFKEGRENKDK
ncbi:MAG: small subunit ribosomal protein S2 [Candidatus Paceibacteria bacterium]|jgi:small subunit ribosomal protein S2